MTKNVKTAVVLFGLAGVFSVIEVSSIGYIFGDWTFFMAWATFSFGIVAIIKAMSDDEI
jgi:hypothetical protein